MIWLACHRYRLITISLDIAMSIKASRIMIWCISPQIRHLMSFVIFQTLAKVAASVATSHSHCWFVAGHLNVRNGVIEHMWGLALK